MTTVTLAAPPAAAAAAATPAVAAAAVEQKEESYTINADRFWTRLKILHSNWVHSRNHGWNGCECILILCGKSANIANQRNNSIHLWLFGYELLSTIIIITNNSINICGGSKTYSTLLPLKESWNESEHKLEINLIQKQKNPKTKNYDDTFAALTNLLRTRVGIIQDFTNLKGFADKFLKHIKTPNKNTNANDPNNFEFVTYSEGLSNVMMIKDKSEQNTIKNVCELTSLSLVYFQQKLMEKLIENNNRKKETHKSLSQYLLKILDAPKIVACSLKPDNLDVCYDPIICSCSSTNFGLKTWQESDSNVIHYEYGTIVVQMGFRLRDYCSNIARTFLIDASNEQKEIYAILLEVYKQGLLLLRDGTKLHVIYDKCHAVLMKSNQGAMLEHHFLKNCGWGIGLEYRDKNYIISKKNTHRVCKRGMIFNFQIGFENLVDRSKAERGLTQASKYSMIIADTVLVTDSRCKFLTRAKRKLIDYSLQGDDDDDNNNNNNNNSNKTSKSKSKRKSGSGDAGAGADSHHNRNHNGNTRSNRSSHKRGKEESALSDEYLPVAGADPNRRVTRSSNRRNAAKLEQESLARAERTEKQHKLRKNNQRKLGQLIANNVDGKNYFAKKKAVEEWKELECYRSKSEFSPKAKFDRLCVDSHRQRECLICPIMDICVAFHISTIKSFSLQQQSGSMNESFLRINFVTPVSITAQNRSKKRQQPAVAKQHPTAMYIKELTYKSRHSENLQMVVAQLKDLQKTVRLRAKQQKEMPLKAQDRLQRASSSKLCLLKEVSCKPSLGGRKQGQGRLECHLNGLRYLDHKRNEISLLFNNIKHAFFQPCKNTTAVLLHFRLHHPIMITSKKSSVDVQIYRDVIERFEEIGGRSRQYDYDGMRAEQEEKRRILRTNKQFLEFSEKVALRSKEGGYPIVFDRPSMSCVIHGVPNKQNTKIFPTNTALIALDDSPPFILSCDEVEIAHFERINFSLKNFDICFVFKDYTREPIKITIIPREYLDTLQDFLNWKNILYSCGRVNLDWKAVMQRVRSDFQEFVECGGWDFLREDDPYLQNDSNRGGGGKRKNGGGSGDEEGVPSGSEYEPDSEDMHSEYSSEGESGSAYNDDDEDDYDDDEDEDDEYEESDEETGEDWEALDKKADEEDRRAKLKERNREFRNDNFSQQSAGRKKRRM